MSLVKKAEQHTEIRKVLWGERSHHLLRAQDLELKIVHLQSRIAKLSDKVADLRRRAEEIKRAAEILAE